MLVDQWVAGKSDVSGKTLMQYEWAAGHIRSGIGGVRVDRLERADVAQWLDGLASEGKYFRRSIQIMRMCSGLHSPMPWSWVSSAAVGLTRWNPPQHRQDQQATRCRSVE